MVEGINGKGSSTVRERKHSHGKDRCHNQIVAWRAVEDVIDAGAALQLQNQVFCSNEAAAPDARRVRIIRLVRAIRRERTLGCRGHWTYNPARHLALLQALRSEKQCISFT